MSTDTTSRDEIAVELADEDSKIEVASAVGNVPESIAYGEIYTLSVFPESADIEVGLYRIDRNTNEIKVAEGVYFGVPAWNTRLAKNFPEGNYKLVVKSLGNTLMVKEYTLKRPAE
jgi:hypothetical protein